MNVKKRVPCPHCRVVVKVKPEHAGKTARCPKCRKAFVIHLPADPSNEIAEQSPVALSEPETIDVALQDTDLLGIVPESALDSLPLGNVGRFHLLASLGQGAFGRVYRAYDPQLDRQVALKVPLFDASDVRRVQRFLAEAKSAGRLRHPNIVPTYESGCSNERYYIASQYVAGRTLAHRLSDEPFEFREAAELVRQLAEALYYAHTQGVVHRDIKPANIMLDESSAPQIMDFGLAKRADDDSGMTIDGAVLGTPAYMAPEQARGETDQVGPKSDQYSLGVVLFELLTGELPYSGKLHDVIDDLLKKETPSPRTRRRDIPRDLDAICQVAMSKSSSDRYASARDFALDLQRWLSDGPVRARPVTLPERVVRWARREPRLAVVGGVALAALLGIVAFSVIFAMQVAEREQLTQSHARDLAAALTDAQEEKKRADAETDRAIEAETEARDREADAIAAQEDAELARKLASERALALQKSLDDLKAAQLLAQSKTSEALTAAKTAETATATAEKAALESQTALFQASLSKAKAALASLHYDDCQKILESCELALRDDEWRSLFNEAQKREVRAIPLEGVPFSVFRPVRLVVTDKIIALAMDRSTIAASLDLSVAPQSIDASLIAIFNNQLFLRSNLAGDTLGVMEFPGSGQIRSFSGPNLDRIWSPNSTILAFDIADDKPKLWFSSSPYGFEFSGTRAQSLTHAAMKNRFRNLIEAKFYPHHVNVVDIQNGDLIASLSYDYRNFGKIPLQLISSNPNEPLPWPPLKSSNGRPMMQLKLRDRNLLYSDRDDVVLHSGTGKEKFRLSFPSPKIISLSDGGRYLAAVSNDGFQIQVWSGGGEVIRSFTSTAPIKALEFSRTQGQASADTLAWASTEGIFLWNAVKPK